MPDTFHHICLISDQNVAELLGGLLSKAASVHIHAITTPKMAARAVHFEKTCLKNQLACSIHELPVAGPGETGALLESVWSAHQADRWLVNITGGTKLMTLGAYSWAARKGIPALYVDTGARVLRFHDSGQWRKLRLPAILGYESLLNLYGYEVEPGAAAHGPDSRAAAGALLDLAGQPQGLAALHYLNDRAMAASAAPDLSAAYASGPCVGKMLEICKNAGKLDYAKSRITFRNEAARKWCNGIWLEEYARAILAGLEAEGKITSWAVNVKISGEGYSNELDAIFTAHNRLHVIECKTSRLAGKTVANSILYKADSLNGRIGGAFARSMLCALDGLSPAEARRARSMGIRTVIGPALKNLPEILNAWIQTP